MVTALNFQAKSHLSTNQAQPDKLFGNQSKAQPENSDSQQLQEYGTVQDAKPITNMALRSGGGLQNF